MPLKNHEIGYKKIKKKKHDSRVLRDIYGGYLWAAIP